MTLKKTRAGNSSKPISSAKAASVVLTMEIFCFPTSSSIFSNSVNTARQLSHESWESNQKEISIQWGLFVPDLHINTATASAFSTVFLKSSPSCSSMASLEGSLEGVSSKQGYFQNWGYLLNHQPLKNSLFSFQVPRIYNGFFTKVLEENNCWKSKHTNLDCYWNNLVETINALTISCLFSDSKKRHFKNTVSKIVKIYFDNW